MSPRPDDNRSTALRVALGLFGVLAALGAVLLVARQLPESWTSASGIANTLRALREDELGFLYVCGAFALMASAFLPITALIAATALVFEPPRAFAFALSGALLSAALSYAIGRAASGRVLPLLNRTRLRKLHEGLRERALPATVVARLLPVGNFNAINLLAGALSIPFGAYMLGNLIGLACGIAGLTLLADRLGELIASPTPANVGVVLVLASAVIGVSLGLPKLLERARRR